MVRINDSVLCNSALPQYTQSMEKLSYQKVFNAVSLNGITRIYAILESQEQSIQSRRISIGKEFVVKLKTSLKHVMNANVTKIVGKLNYGILPLVPALHNKKPFEKVQLNCAGPWIVRVKDESSTQDIEYEIHILTMVDVCTNWTELALIPTAKSKTVAT